VNLFNSASIWHLSRNWAGGVGNWVGKKVNWPMLAQLCFTDILENIFLRIDSISHVMMKKKFPHFTTLC